ncbi:MAG TPA: polysaccharide biosynthesis/export family protein [Candidatus Acidoferrales bacterium]|nr:polysaccharide biosynthesis/export family protein [Candidatus Acidoferrales bacterium]
MSVLVVCCAPAYGQQKLETPQQTNEKIQAFASLGQGRPVDTQIGAGDLLHVDVFDVPELSRDVRVSETGDIGYPLIPGKISVAGQTPSMVEAKLQQLLVENGLVSHPQVSVFVKEQNSHPISVVGAVNHPMVLQAARPTTLLEVLAAAGGVSDNAGSDILVTRKERAEGAMVKKTSATINAGPEQQVITIRLQDLLETGNAIYNIPVYGGDVVSVPKAGVVYVMGAGIAQQGGYVVENHGEQITVLRAVALAHGLTGYAKANSAVIIRTNPVTGKKERIPVQIKKIEKHNAEDVPLEANDILYIPDSAGKKVLAQGTEAAIGVGSGVAIYRAAY